MYDVPSTTIFTRRSKRSRVVIVLTISTNTRITLTKRSVKTATAPPGQSENGAVASMTPPSDRTASSSGVIRLSGAPRPRRPAIKENAASAAVRSARWSGSRKGNVSCGRTKRTKVKARSALNAAESCRSTRASPAATLASGSSVRLSSTAAAGSPHENARRSISSEFPFLSPWVPISTRRGYERPRTNRPPRHSSSSRTYKPHPPIVARRRSSCSPRRVTERGRNGCSVAALPNYPALTLVIPADGRTWSPELPVGGISSVRPVSAHLLDSTHPPKAARP